MSSLDTMLIAELERFLQRLNRSDALLVRRAIDEMRDLRHELDTTNELMDGVVIQRGPNFPEQSA